LATDYDGRTALHLASSDGQLHVVEALRFAVRWAEDQKR